MVIAKDRVVSVHYAIHKADGELVESNSDDEPLLTLQGRGVLLGALEQALEGRAAGDTVSVALNPEQAFGERREDFVQRLSKKYLQNAARLKPGMQTTLQTKDGPRTVTVLKVGGKVVDVDLNHPLAGLALNFDLEVVDVRAATAEELAHGHAHGAGGHHH
ncbi:MAG: peptidylprolyl isomerase [Gammaproteobacteria bacterium]